MVMQLCLRILNNSRAIGLRLQEGFETSSRIRRSAFLSIAFLCIFPCLVAGANDSPGTGSESVRAGLMAGSVPTFPRIMGLNIAKDNYTQPQYVTEMARADVVILGFYPGWNPDGSRNPFRDVVRAIKRKNPQVLVGAYTILSEAQEDTPRYSKYADKAQKLDKENWWLRRSDGSKVQWTSDYDAYEVNITDWVRPDAKGRRYPQWLAERDHQLLFRNIPEMDIWYFDGVYWRQRIRRADWDLDGKDDDGDDPRIQQAFRRGEAAEWARARELAPKVLLMGNADNDLSYPEYRGKLQAVFLEGMMGYSWSLINRGWDKMMDRYHSVFNNLAAPRIVGFHVSGRVNDYKFFRFAYTSCLMDDGYLSFSDETVGAASVPWFDEYDVKLGRAVDPPQLVPWQDGVYRRRFANGMALVNPTIGSKTVSIGKGFRRIGGRQAPRVNSGAIVDGHITIAARDGIVLVQQ